MNLSTHILAGIIIQIFCFKILIFPINIIFTIIFSFLSHFIIDAFVCITYHPPDPQKGDRFWISWQIITYGGGLIAIIFFLPYWLGMLFANLVDIVDWLILRPIHEKKAKNEQIDWHRNYFFHNTIRIIREKTLFWLPNWIYEKKAAITEIILNVILLSVILIVNL